METILLIEDLESLGNMLSQALSHVGFDVILVNNGLDGITALKKGGVDLVVTDLKLPKKNGMEVLRAVKEHSPEIPVILIPFAFVFLFLFQFPALRSWFC